MTEPRQDECVKIYRLAAVVVSAALLVALVTMLMLAAEHGSTDPLPTTTVLEASNDGVVSDAERAAGSFSRGLTIVTLNLLARVVCGAVAVGPDRAAVERVVTARAQVERPDVPPAVVANLVGRVAGLACAGAYAALPAD
jgi:hypothetical protein